MLLEAAVLYLELHTPAQSQSTRIEIGNITGNAKGGKTRALEMTLEGNMKLVGF